MFGIYFLPYSLFSFHFSDFCPEASYIFREIFPSQMIRHYWQRVVTNCLMCMQFKGIKTQVSLCINITIPEIETEVVVTYNSWNCVWFKIVLVLELSLAGWRVDEESSLLYMEKVHCKGVLPRVLLSYLRMQHIQWRTRYLNSIKQKVQH